MMYTYNLATPTTSARREVVNYLFKKSTKSEKEIGIESHAHLYVKYHPILQIRYNPGHANSAYKFPGFMYSPHSLSSRS